MPQDSWPPTAPATSSQFVVSALARGAGVADGLGRGEPVAAMAAGVCAGCPAASLDSQGLAIAAAIATRTTIAPITAGSTLRRLRSSLTGSNSTLTPDIVARVVGN